MLRTRSSLITASLFFLSACAAPEGGGSVTLDGGPDLDGDGWGANVDCDDGNPLRFPNNPEVCDEIDNDCDQDVDEGLLQTYYLDSDMDTYGVDTATITACTMPMGYAARGGDCDDRVSYRDAENISVYSRLRFRSQSIHAGRSCRNRCRPALRP